MVVPQCVGCYSFIYFIMMFCFSFNLITVSGSESDMPGIACKPS